MIVMEIVATMLIGMMRWMNFHNDKMIRICSFSLYFYLDRLTGLYRCEFVYGKEIDILSKFHVDETFYNDEITIWPLFHSFFLVVTDPRTDGQTKRLKEMRGRN